jgi:hypothetical protein
MPCTSNWPLVEWAETGRQRVAEPDHAEKLVVDGVVTETVFENCSAE